MFHKHETLEKRLPELNLKPQETKLNPKTRPEGPSGATFWDLRTAFWAPVGAQSHPKDPQRLFVSNPFAPRGLTWELNAHVISAMQSPVAQAAIQIALANILI